MIRKSIEGKRGCGYRKPGGLYMVSDGVGRDCGKLPIPLKVCPTCSCGIKPARGWTWVDGEALIKTQECSYDVTECGYCPLGLGPRSQMARVGLIWIGEKFYTPSEWLAEGVRIGFSRRISSIPREFVLGETWVFAAHRKAIAKLGFGKEPEYTPGIFHIWKPSRIEYIVKEGDSVERLNEIAARGISLVEVEYE